MKFTQFTRDIKNSFFPVVVVEGEDAYLRQSALTKLRENLDISMPELNVSVLNGTDTSIKEILTLANAFPAFSSKRMITVKDFAISKKSDKQFAELTNYCQNPNDATCLAFVFSQGKCGIALPNCTVVDCSKLDTATIVAWIESNLKLVDKKIDRRLAQKIAEYCDRDMFKVWQSVNKLESYCIGDITDEAVELLVPKDVEYAVFALSNALVEKNYFKTIEICTKLLGEEESSKILATVYSCVRRMFYACVSDLSEADLAKKLSVETYAVTKAREQGGRFGAVKLKRAMELCADAEKNLKNFDGNDKEIVFDLVLTLCNL